MALNNLQELLEQRRKLWGELTILAEREMSIDQSLIEAQVAVTRLEEEKGKIKKQQTVAYNNYQEVNERLAKPKGE